MEIYEEAIRRIDQSDMNNLEIYKLIESENDLSKLFYFKGDSVKYNHDEYVRLKRLIRG